jgi:hypothetical protein
MAGWFIAARVEVSETHLAQLRQNAQAYSQQLSRYDQEIQGCQYQNVPTSRYRVWCLEELQRAWGDLDDRTCEILRSHIRCPDASILWDEATFSASNYDTDRQAPFNSAINVFGQGVPPP